MEIIDGLDAEQTGTYGRLVAPATSQANPRHQDRDPQDGVAAGVGASRQGRNRRRSVAEMKTGMTEQGGGVLSAAKRQSALRTKVTMTDTDVMALGRPASRSEHRRDSVVPAPATTARLRRVRSLRGRRRIVTGARRRGFGGSGPRRRSLPRQPRARILTVLVDARRALAAAPTEGKLPPIVC